MLDRRGKKAGGAGGGGEQDAAVGKRPRTSGRTIFRDGDGAAAPGAAVDRALGKQGRGTPHASGASFHTDATAASASAELGARAFTAGNDVYFGAGQHAPETSSGQTLIQHELTHVAQGRGVPAPAPGNFKVSDPGQAEEVEARGAAASPGKASAGTIFREVDTAGTAVADLASPALGPQGGAALGGAIGTAVNVGEAHAAGTADTDPLQVFRTAVLGGDPAQIDTAWKAIPRNHRAALAAETDTLLRMMQAWGPKSMHALAAVGVGFHTDVRFAQHVLWQPDIAAWKAEMTGAQWRAFITSGPQKDALDRASLDGIGQSIRATSHDSEARTLFERAFPKLLHHASEANDAWTQFQAAGWTHDRVMRLFDAFASGPPIGHVAGATGGILLATKIRERDEDDDPWPHHWKPMGYGLWTGDTNCIVMPYSSAGGDGGEFDHSMVGGNNEGGPINPMVIASHWTSSALHEIGHAVGQNIAGNDWAENSGPAAFHQFSNSDDATNLQALIAELWDPAVIDPAAADQRSLSEAEAKAALAGYSATGTLTVPAGWDQAALTKAIRAQYHRQPFVTLLNDSKREGDSGFKHPVTKGTWAYSWMSRWGDSFGKYKKDALDNKVSWYSLSSPLEWFAEQYNRYYSTNRDGSGLHADTKAFLDNLDSQKMAAPGATPAAGPGGSTPAGGETAGTAGAGTQAAAPKPKAHRSSRRFPWSW